VISRYKIPVLYLALAALMAPPVWAEEKPPLLRRPWVEAEKQRMLDWLSGMQNRKGEVRGFWWLQDGHGRSFILSGTGLDSLILETMPVSVPYDSDAPLHMAEARARYSGGQPEEAARLWKTFNALAALEIPAYQKKAARESARMLQNTGLSFTGPVVIFRTEQKETLVSHPEHGYRFSLPEQYRAARFRFKKAGRRRSMEPGELHTLALKRKLVSESGKRKEAIIITSSDVLDKFIRPRDCRILWRDRTGYTPGSTRSAGLNETVKKESDNELLVSVSDGTPGAWLEYYRVKDTTCLHVRILVPEFSIMDKSMQNALVLEGRKFEDPLELYDAEMAREIFEDLVANLSGP
tara:strand:+ start:45445 stop:46497 length:1053 start_codon:yes stop_codon:yes gene_type:complete